MAPQFHDISKMPFSFSAHEYQLPGLVQSDSAETKG
jgi:hypothetical protein